MFVGYGNYGVGKKTSLHVADTYVVYRYSWSKTPFESWIAECWKSIFSRNEPLNFLPCCLDQRRRGRGLTIYNLSFVPLSVINGFLERVWTVGIERPNIRGKLVLSCARVVKFHLKHEIQRWMTCIRKLWKYSLNHLSGVLPHFRIVGVIFIR